MNTGIYCFFILMYLAQCGSYWRQLSTHSSIVYKQANSITSWTCQQCSQYKVSDAKAYTNNGLQFFTGYSWSLEGIVLSIRGTQNFKNIITDLTASLVDYPRCSKCKVHKGTYNAWKILRDPIFNQLTTLRSLYKDQRIFITGHSLGGSIGALALPEILQKFGNVQGFVTFGQPRVGNSQHAKYMNGIKVEKHRIVHNADIVPHLPPSISGYEHFDYEYWFTKDMKSYQKCQAQSKKCSNSIMSLKYKLDEHLTKYYLKLPQSILDQVWNKISTASHMIKHLNFIFHHNKLRYKHY